MKIKQEKHNILMNHIELLRLTMLILNIHVYKQLPHSPPKAHIYMRKLLEYCGAEFNFSFFVETIHYILFK